MDDDEVEIEGQGPDAVEERITDWVQQGMAMTIRRLGADTFDKAIGDPCAEIVDAMTQTIAHYEQLPTSGWVLSTLYQRAMESMHRDASGIHAHGFMLDKVPVCVMPDQVWLIDFDYGTADMARWLDNMEALGVVGGVDPGDVQYIRGEIGAGDEEDEVREQFMQEAWESIERDAWIVDPRGIAWTLATRDGGISAIPTYMEWNDRADNYEIMPGGVAHRDERRGDMFGAETPLAFGAALANTAFGIRPRGPALGSTFLAYMDSMQFAPSLGMMAMIRARMTEVRKSVTGVFTMSYDTDTKKLEWRGFPVAQGSVILR